MQKSCIYSDRFWGENFLSKHIICEYIISKLSYLLFRSNLDVGCCWKNGDSTENFDYKTWKYGKYATKYFGKNQVRMRNNSSIPLSIVKTVFVTKIINEFVIMKIDK